jgi:DNA-binding Lrp family transcriptional regulator
MKLDDIDKQIIDVLYKDGRESLKNIGDQVFKDGKETMSHTGVNKRIKKLEKEDIMKVQGNIKLEHINYKACYILLEMANYDYIQNIIKAYDKCPRVFLLNQLTGRYNLIMGVIGQSVDVLHRYINHCGPTNKEGILHSEVLFVSDFRLPEFIPLNLFSSKSNECNCGNVCKNCEAFLDGNCEGCGNF